MRVWLGFLLLAWGIIIGTYAAVTQEDVGPDLYGAMALLSVGACLLGSAYERILRAVEKR